MSAIIGTFVKIGTMADGTPRLVLDLECSLSEVADMNLIPGVPFAIARMTKEAAKPKQDAPKEKPGDLCIMACEFCKDEQFWKWITASEKTTVNNEHTAKSFIYYICGIESRKELDKCETSAYAFHEYIRKPFLAWKAAQ